VRHYSVDFGFTDEGMEVALIARGKPDDDFSIVVDIQSGRAVWLLDGEPTDALPEWREEAEKLAVDLGAKRGITVVFVASP